MKNEEDKLINFFRDEGRWLGGLGDDNGWTPAETAIQAMRELLKANPYPAISQVPSPRMDSVLEGKS